MKIKSGYKVYRALAPGPWFKSVTWAEYEVLYAAQLAELHPVVVLQDLIRLADGSPPVLLCWENIHKGERCHRQLVASWLKRELGIAVDELPAVSNEPRFNAVSARRERIDL